VLFLLALAPALFMGLLGAMGATVSAPNAGGVGDVLGTLLGFALLSPLAYGALQLRKRFLPKSRDAWADFIDRRAAGKKVVDPKAAPREGRAGPPASRPRGRGPSHLVRLIRGGPARRVPPRDRVARWRLDGGADFPPLDAVIPAAPPGIRVRSARVSRTNLTRGPTRSARLSATSSLSRNVRSSSRTPSSIIPRSWSRSSRRSGRARSST
jgi:hypothetical protein